MRDRRRHLVGLSVAALLLVPAAASASVGLSDGVASLASPDQRPFIGPQPRPTEGRSRSAGGSKPHRRVYAVPQAPGSPRCDLHFCVHWVAKGIDAPRLTDGDGDRVPDFVQQVLESAEYVHEIENERLGWREPKSDGSTGGRVGKTDIYLAQMGPALFGYASPDRGQGTKENRVPRRLHGFLVLDDDYSASEYPESTPLDNLQVTLAHEYNHILQFGYDAFQDPWFAEASATWMEDQVYDIDDYLYYMRDWVKNWQTPLTANSIKVYGSAVWNQWLERRYGDAIVRKAWARAIHLRPGGFSVNAYETAIRAAGRSDFGRDFSHFAAAAAEWRTGEVFREGGRFPDLPRQGRLRLDGRPSTRQLNHTTYEMLGVRAAGGSAVAVGVSAPRGIAAGLALIGRLGGERQGQTITRFDFSRGGGRLAVRLDDPGSFSRITAVVVNADADVNGFNADSHDWRYLTDQVPFELRGRLIRYRGGR